MRGPTTYHKNLLIANSNIVNIQDALMCETSAFEAGNNYTANQKKNVRNGSSLYLISLFLSSETISSSLLSIFLFLCFSWFPPFFTITSIGITFSIYLFYIY